MLIRFTKMHGLGNDFMLLDLISQNIHLGEGRMRSLADRRLGIGFDQLLTVGPPSNPSADFLYRIFNADGTEVCLLYTSPSPRDAHESRMPSSA